MILAFLLSAMVVLAGQPSQCVARTVHCGGDIAITDTLPTQDTGSGKLRGAGPQEIVFLLDVSNSMGQGRKMDLLKGSMMTLLDKLRPVDRVTLIVFGNDVTPLFRTTSFVNPDSLLRIIEHIRSTATATNVNGAIDLAYEQMVATPPGTTRQEVFLITDGEFKLNKRVIALVKDNARVRLTAVIVGEGAAADKAVTYVRETLGLDVVTLVNQSRDVNKLLDHIQGLTGAPLK